MTPSHWNNNSPPRWLKECFDILQDSELNPDQKIEQVHIELSPIHPNVISQHIDTKGPQGKTLLILAAENGFPEFARQLMFLGADPRIGVYLKYHENAFYPIEMALLKNHPRTAAEIYRQMPEDIRDKHTNPSIIIPYFQRITPSQNTLKTFDTLIGNTKPVPCHSNYPFSGGSI